MGWSKDYLKFSLISGDERGHLQISLSFRGGGGGVGRESVLKFSICGVGFVIGLFRFCFVLFFEGVRKGSF